MKSVHDTNLDIPAVAIVNHAGNICSTYQLPDLSARSRISGELIAIRCAGGIVFQYHY